MPSLLPLVAAAAICSKAAILLLLDHDDYYCSNALYMYGWIAVFASDLRRS